MARAWFVTGTDTGVGKTLVSQALLAAFVCAGRRAVGMKPVASGCEASAAGLRSADAAALIAAGNVAVDYKDVNPYAFAPATAPHLAAAAAHVQIDAAVIDHHYRRLAALADEVVVEGVGGWLVPIGEHTTMADIVRLRQWPVILVVGLRLGAMNHALLTSAAIGSHGCRLAGWVANAVEPLTPPGYVDALRARLAAPLVGAIPYRATLATAARCLNLDRLAPVAG